MTSKKPTKAQTASDYEDIATPRGRELMKPLTPQKSNPPVPRNNRFAPLNLLPDVPYSTIAKTNVQKPLSPIPNDTPTHKYFEKCYIEDMGLTNFTDNPSESAAREYINDHVAPSYPWETSNPYKTKKFYELILVDTNSAEITHNKNDDFITLFSKCIIKHFITPDEWGQPLSTRNFSIKFSPCYFNYIDYKNAWFKTFFFKPTSHSWFFIFHSNYKNNFPIWVYDWSKRFGPELTILPAPVKEGFLTFVDNSKLKHFQQLLGFHAEFKVPWIFAWDFVFQKIWPDPIPFSLTRIFRVKWWPKYQNDIASAKSIQRFFQTGTKTQYDSKPSREASSSSSKGHHNPDETIEGLSPHQKTFFEFIKQNPNYQDQFMEFVSKQSNTSDEQTPDPHDGPDPFDFMR